MYDAIVVGARCAGAPAAMLLAAKGYRVLLVDRATFPSDTISSHHVQQPAVASLKRWGLLDKLLATKCPPTKQWTFDVGPFALHGSPLPAGDVADGYAPRRTVLDKLLVDAAVEAGAEMREGFLVQEILMDDSRVIGIRGHPRGGQPVTEKARIVIGADGKDSRVARAVQAPTYNERPTLECAYYSYWSGIPLSGMELYIREGRAILALPTNDDLALLLVGWPIADFPAVRADVERNYMKSLELAPGLAERASQGKREERIVGTGDLPNFFRKPYGDGWALVGDAGYHKDPVTAQGITDAFRDAEVLANAIDDGLSGRRTLNEALAEYEQKRNQAVLPIYYYTLQLADLAAPPPPEMQQLLGAMRENPQATNRFFGTIAGTMPVGEFFAPEHIARIVGAG
jgi:flavin-dependent dehydrogenase